MAKKKSRAEYEDEQLRPALPRGEDEPGERYLSFVESERRSFGVVTRRMETGVEEQQQTFFIAAEEAETQAVVCMDSWEERWMEGFALDFEKIRAKLVLCKIEATQLHRPPSGSGSWIELFSCHLPAVSFLQQLDQVTCRRAIAVLRSWLVDGVNAVVASPSVCCWVFGLVAVLEEPMDSDTVSDLQALAKRLSNPLELEKESAQVIISMRIAVIAMRRHNSSLCLWKK